MNTEAHDTTTPADPTPPTPAGPSIEDQIAALETQRAKAAKAAASSPSVETIEAVEAIDAQLTKLRKVQLAQAAKRDADRARRQAKLNDSTLKELARSHQATRARAAKAVRRAAVLEAELRDVLSECDACGAELVRVSREALALGGVLRAHTNSQLIQIASGHAGAVLGNAGRNVGLLLASGSAGRPGGHDPVGQLECGEDASTLVNFTLTRAVNIQCPEPVTFEAGRTIATTSEFAAELVEHRMGEVIQ